MLPSAYLIRGGYGLEHRTNFTISLIPPAGPLPCASASKRWEHLFLKSLARLYGIFTPPDPTTATLGDPSMSLKSRRAPTEDGSEHLGG